VERDEYDKISRVFISAQSGAGLDLLRDAIVEAASRGPYREAQDDADARFAQADVQLADSILPSTHGGPH
jgi:GTP-binding protein HflX